ncbi:unnamed protein product [Cyprideis torosa]|uniref:Dihydrolipoamide acetyltransferase component of pyruvate dehydrogenase complex n=1 Tax=Cyprideis torosa TaxID=163714 RepID=A0A7R8ZKX0_9CRUS|nr:unnamed protein product [Cyprideis torosa]CAG0885302.1 unnamed protein product [Cyprideis torosa]
MRLLLFPRILLPGCFASSQYSGHVILGSAAGQSRRHGRCLHLSPIWNVKGMEIKMPSLSPTMAEGTIVKWLKQEGDPLTAGEVLCDIQTDKAVMSMETEEEGILAKIIVPENTKDVKVGTLIALMVEEGEDWKSVEVPTISTSKPPETSTAATPDKPVVPTGRKIMLGPGTRNLLDRYGLEPSKIPEPTGKFGNILREDVLKYIEKNKLEPISLADSAPPPGPPAMKEAAKHVASEAKKAEAKAQKSAPFVDIELTSMRKTIARRLSESKQGIPHAYSVVTCQLDAVMKLRQQMKDEGIDFVSINDFIVKAIAESLKRVPQLNCVWEKGELTYPRAIDVSVAVATPAGLITPIVKGAGLKSLPEIAKNVKDLAGRARAGKLKPDEFLGGTFTLSNLGMFGIYEFSAIINPPQCAILAVGGGRKEFIDDLENPTTMMSAQLSYDARAVTEEEAAMFLATFSETLRYPSLLITSSRRLSAFLE